MATAAQLPDDTTELSAKYETPLGLAHGTMQALKDRIKQHYDLASDYYLSLWGEHIHHGYWPTAESRARDSKETAQTNLIALLLDTSKAVPSRAGGDATDAGRTPTRVLDVGCGLGGTSRHLAAAHGCEVTGVTISERQVELAGKLSRKAASLTKGAPATTAAIGDAERAAATPAALLDTPFIPIGASGGRVRFLELDAEKLGDVFPEAAVDVVWISEALSHFPDKPLFFRNACRVLRPGGKLVLADWFKNEGLTEKQFNDDIKPIEDGMLLPPLCTQQDYVRMATEAGLKLFSGPQDVSKDVSKTWDISWSLVQNPALWAFAISQGRDGIAFLQSFRAMRRGYSNGSFRYAVMSFEKP